jgi:H+-transporting ATPase
MEIAGVGKAVEMSMPSQATAAHGRPDLAGLSSAQAASVRAEFGPNAVVEEPIHPLGRFARHFWAPVPWMLEATIGLQIILGQWLTASMIAAVLLFNSSTSCSPPFRKVAPTPLWRFSSEA